MSPIRCIVANNPSPMTLDGTRTYLVGNKRVAVIDPGPLLDEHIDAVADAVGSGVSATVLITHAHPDHSDAAFMLAQRLGTHTTQLHDGDVIATDSGELRAIATPGHTPDHFALHFPAESAVFCGDLMMGGLDTALVALPEGDLHDYLRSLAKLRALQPGVIYPAHGEPFYDADAAIDRYIQHRQDRVAQVVQALQHGNQTADGLIDDIYGAELDPRLRSYAASAIEAYLAYLAADGRAQIDGDGMWSVK
ncbi:MAG TPA: MBL fold metallo-hydrolase [Longimicrobiales bacterium]